METTNTAPTKANDARQIVADKIVDDFGIDYFNPLIGASAGQTCAKIEPLMEMLYELSDRNLISGDMNPGIKLIINTVWAAMQYEREVLSKEEEVTE